MRDERKTRRELRQQVDALRSRVAQIEQAEPKRSDEELKVFERRFGKILDSVTEAMLLLDVENKRIVAGNKVICQMLGRNPKEFKNLGVMNIHPQKDLDYIMEQFEKQARGELALAKDVPVKRKDGSVLYADIDSLPVTLAGKAYLMSVFRETHPRKAKSIMQQSASADSYAGKPLTKSEMGVLRLIVGGLSNKEIAQLLHRSIRTIENHRAHLMHKLGVKNSVELVKRAAAMGVVDLPAKRKRGKAARNSENHP